MMARLLGMKVVESGHGYKVIRMPLWANEKMVSRAADRIRRDAALLGHDIKITCGARLIRIDGLPDA